MFNWSHILTAALLLNVWRCQLYLLNNLNINSNIYFYGSQSVVFLSQPIRFLSAHPLTNQRRAFDLLCCAERTEQYEWLWMAVRCLPRRESEREGGGERAVVGGNKRQARRKQMARVCLHVDHSENVIVWARRRIFSCHCVVCAAQSQT